MRETFDLDALFADLERDISDVTHSPGAAHAVRGARRRRRTTIGGVAAGLALVLGSVLVGRGAFGHDHSAPPADQVIQMGRLPDPSPFHDPDFDAVFAGWETGWFYDDDLGKDPNARLSLLVNLPCWRHLGQRTDAPHPTTVTKNGTVVSGSHLSTAFIMWTHVRSADDASQVFDTWSSEADGCTGAQRIQGREWTRGAEATTWTMPTADGVSGHEYLLLARVGDGFAAAQVATQKGDLPDEVETRLAETLVAGLQDPSSGGPGPSS